MLHLHKHDSYDTPPCVPYFKKASVHLNQAPTAPTEAEVTSISTSSGVISPGKRVTMRTECIDQLKKWHDLLEEGAITRSEYDKVQEVILKDMI